MRRLPAKIYDKIIEVMGDDPDYVYHVVKEADPTAEKISIDGKPFIGCTKDHGIVMGRLADDVKIHKL